MLRKIDSVAKRITDQDLEKLKEFNIDLIFENQRVFKTAKGLLNARRECSPRFERAVKQAFAFAKEQPLSQSKKKNDYVKSVYRQADAFMWVIGGARL